MSKALNSYFCVLSLYLSFILTHLCNAQTRNYTVALRIGPLPGDRSFQNVWFRIQGSIDNVSKNESWTEWFASDKFRESNTTFILERALTDVGDPIKLIVLMQINNNVGVVGVGVDDLYYTIDPTIYIVYYDGQYAGYDGCSFITVNFVNNTLKDDTTTYTGYNDVCPWQNQLPTLEPTNRPTTQPTVDPTMDPSIDPTRNPSMNPSVMPSMQPSIETIDPTHNPSLIPSTVPSNNPTSMPIKAPTYVPSTNPSISIMPSMEPSIYPTNNPSLTPSIMPSSDPSMTPSNEPSSNPSIAATLMPIANTTSLSMTNTENQESGKERKNSLLWIVILLIISPLVICVIIILVTLRRKGYICNNSSKMESKAVPSNSELNWNENKAPNANIHGGTVATPQAPIAIAIENNKHGIKNTWDGQGTIEGEKEQSQSQSHESMYDSSKETRDNIDIVYSNDRTNGTELEMAQPCQIRQGHESLDNDAYADALHAYVDNESVAPQLKDDAQIEGAQAMQESHHTNIIEY